MAPREAAAPVALALLRWSVGSPRAGWEPNVAAPSDRDDDTSRRRRGCRVDIPWSRREGPVENSPGRGAGSRAGPRAGGAVAKRLVEEGRAALGAATRRAAAAPLEDLTQEELLRAALLHRLARVWDSEDDGATDAWTTVLEALATFGAGAAPGGEQTSRRLRDASRGASGRVVSSPD